MSDESISYKEDKENLLYITRKIHVQELIFGEDPTFLHESIQDDDRSEDSLGRIGSDIHLIEQHKTLGPALFAIPEVIVKTCPFEINWSYGVNSDVAIFNLTNKQKTQLFFANSHIPIIYDYCKKEMKHLPGHSTPIKTLGADLTGKYLASLEVGPGGSVLVWDNTEEEITPIFTLFDVCPVAMWTLTLSKSGKILMTVGETEDDYRIDCWWWTYGNTKPDDSYYAPKSWGTPRQIAAHPQNEEHIMVIFSHSVLFLTLDSTTKKFTKPTIPTLSEERKIGKLNGGTYPRRCHECFVATTKGCILVFGNTLYPRLFHNEELDNAKIYRNAVRVAPVSVNTICSIDGMVVTGDNRGYVYFFDRKLRILYWLRNLQLPSIQCIVFSHNLKFKRNESKEVDTFLEDKILHCDFEDHIEEIENIIQREIPADASLENKPFIARDFFIVTAYGDIFVIDCSNSTCRNVFQGIALVSAIDTHDEKNYLVMGHCDGTMRLLNVEENKIICTGSLPKLEEHNQITAIKFSHEGLHLVCGRENGDIWILEPILLTPIIDEPFTPTNNKVVKIEFSPSPLQFAYYDTNRTVVLFSFNMETMEWELTGKIRSHYDTITDLTFLPSNPGFKLYTISEDRNLVEYNNDQYLVQAFDVVSTDRIEQSAKPMCFTFWIEPSTDDKQLSFILLADDKHKFKFLYQSTKALKSIVLGPAFGCFQNQLTKKMRIIPMCESRYMVFCTSQYIGLQMLPTDGNPYKYVGYLAHPLGLGDFALSHDGKYVFTFGAVDGCLYKWEIKTRAVELMSALGGKELEPFYCLIEGGRNGWLLNEMKDLFYYVQILQQENKDLPRRVSDSISVNDIPDLFRTCGYFPSEFELENLMIDVKYRNYDRTQKFVEDINFVDFVKLYCNHKPVYGYNLADIDDAFLTLMNEAEEPLVDGITREEFLSFLTNEGEPMTMSSLYKCLRVLVRKSSDGGEAEDNFSFLPEELNLQTLCDDILGIDMYRENINKDGDDEADKGSDQ